MTFSGEAVGETVTVGESSEVGETFSSEFLPSPEHPVNHKNVPKESKTIIIILSLISKLLKFDHARVFFSLLYNKYLVCSSFFVKNKPIGVDETSCAKGHDYVTLGVDMEKSKVIFATKGKDFTTLARFNKDLFDHGRDALNVREN